MIIRRATIQDVSKIMKFIDVNWKQNYILGQDEDFFRWQFVEDDNVNFIIAEDEEEGELYGIQGYIPYSNSSTPDIAGSILKVLRTEDVLLGVKIVDNVNRFTNHRWCVSPGLSKRAMKMEKLKGYDIQKMEHFYWLNPLEEYKIAKIRRQPLRLDKNPSSKSVKLEIINDYARFDALLPDEYLMLSVPEKDKNYLKHRYFEHPVYDYFALGIREENRYPAFLICREVAFNGAKILKIVNFIGEEQYLAYIREPTEQFIKESGYEYIDFYLYGIDENFLREGGFEKIMENDDNVIPNYFEPFVQENIDIYFSKPKTENVRLYIGDGDQDRPTFTRS